MLKIWKNKMKMSKVYRFAVIVVLALSILSGCKSENDKLSDVKEQVSETVTETVTEVEEGKKETIDETNLASEEARILENEGDVEIIVPYDQEMGGE